MVDELARDTRALSIGRRTGQSPARRKSRARARGATPVRTAAARNSWEVPPVTADLPGSARAYQQQWPRMAHASCPRRRLSAPSASSTAISAPAPSTPSRRRPRQRLVAARRHRTRSSASCRRREERRKTSCCVQVRAHRKTDSATWQVAAHPFPSYQAVSYSARGVVQPASPCASGCRCGGGAALPKVGMQGSGRHDQIRSNQAARRREPASLRARHRADRGHGVRADRLGPGARRSGRAARLRRLSPPARVASGSGATRAPATRWPCRARLCRTSNPAKQCSTASTLATDRQIRAQVAGSALAEPTKHSHF